MFICRECGYFASKDWTYRDAICDRRISPYYFRDPACTGQVVYVEDSEEFERALIHVRV